VIILFEEVSLQKSLKGKTLSDYNLAIKEFCNDNKDLTVYLAGEISHPGISDLDFLVVNSKPKISQEVNLFLSGGNVIIMPDFFMSKARDFENLNLTLLQGKDHQVKKPSKYFKYVEIIEWLPERILKLKSMKQKYFSEQDLMLLHKSVNRSVKSVIQITGKEIDIIEEDSVRSDKAIDKQLILQKTIDYATLAWLNFEKYIIENKIIYGTCRGDVRISSYYKFCNKFNVLSLYFNRLTEIKDNELSKKLHSKTSLSGHYFLDPEFEKYVVSRWEDINTLYLWFKENNFKRGMIKYGWFL